MNFLGSLAVPAVGAYWFVWTLGLIAPSGKKVVATVGATLLVVLTLGLLMLDVANGSRQGILPSVAYCVGAIAGALNHSLEK